MGYIKSNEKTNYVQIEMGNGGKIVIELNEEAAPITVENFKDLVSQKFYDGLIFHRVIKDFMIQGGDPTGTGFSGSGKTIKGEFEINGVKNPMSHMRGVIAMARSMDPNSASSQFFICHQNVRSLDGQYATFGQVIEGIEVVDEIANVKTNGSDKPLEDQVMKTVTFVKLDK